MKTYTKLTIALYIVELFIIGIILGGLYYFSKPLLEDGFFIQGVGMFATGVIAYKYLDAKWRENKKKIFKVRMRIEL